MSFGGSVLAMIVSLKNNARPKRKAFAYSKGKEAILKKRYGLKYKSISAEKLSAIKSKIKRQTERENKQKMLKLVFILTMVLASLLILSIHFQKSVKENNSKVVKERKLSLNQ